MKCKKTLTLLLTVLVVGMLSACGSSSAVGSLKAGEIIEISYDELIEKLDDKETFLLLPFFYSYDDFVNSGLSEVVEERLDEEGVGIYYSRVYLKKEDEEKHTELASYIHPENELYDGIGADVWGIDDSWFPASDGLVYVTEGKVITLNSSQTFAENSNRTPFGSQMDINDVANHEYYGDSVSQSLMKYESLDFE